MNRCPKCGCYHVAGPMFRRTAWGSEYLRYTCTRCGFHADEATLDSETYSRVPQPLPGKEG